MVLLLSSILVFQRFFQGTDNVGIEKIEDQLVPLNKY
jgi:hypothetical protein